RERKRRKKNSYQSQEMSETECKGKSSWPELLGTSGKKAEKIIEKENPLVDAVIVDENTSVILDFRCDRVWVWTNSKTGKVFQVPTIG
ncbi:serine protease inhibitor, partial [Salmonella sp. NW1113]|uniref:serine protease inhibitor n=1 Tax=Salmonella sp. NW1113 TaxID=2947551 RepID=UPI003F45039A